MIEAFSINPSEVSTTLRPMRELNLAIGSLAIHALINRLRTYSWLAVQLKSRELGYPGLLLRWLTRLVVDYAVAFWRTPSTKGDRGFISLLLLKYLLL